MHLPLHLKQRQQPSPSKPSHQRKADHEGGDGFDENQCCVCFRTYKEDVVEDLIGYSVHARDGSMKSVLIMI